MRSVIKLFFILGVIAMVAAGAVYATTIFQAPEAIPQTEKVADALAAGGMIGLAIAFVLYLLGGAD